jgi:hypothetical protein
VRVVDPDACAGSVEGGADCVVQWDAWRDRYFDLTDDAFPSRLHTDAWGLARLYMHVDAFPSDAGDDFAPIEVVVSMGELDDTFLLVPR